MGEEKTHEGHAFQGMDLSDVHAEPGYMSDSEVEAKLKEMYPPPPPLTLEGRLRRWAVGLTKDQLISEVISLWKKAHRRRRTVVELTGMLNQEVAESDRLQDRLDDVQVDFSTLEGEA